MITFLYGNCLVFIDNMKFCVDSRLQYILSISSNPLFSSIITLYTLILLYFPNQFIRIVLSPVLIITGFLLLTLLRLGAAQRLHEQDHNDSEYKNLCQTQLKVIEKETKQSKELYSDHEYHKWVTEKSNIESETEMSFGPNPSYEEPFLEWNVRAPLEVIYEEYEEEEEEEEGKDVNEKDPNNKEENQVMGIQRYPSLSLCYPESDSDSSSDGEYPPTGDWKSSDNLCFRWEEDQDERDGLIEIALDGNNGAVDFHVEEENMIEINISPTRNDNLFGNIWRFPDEVKCV